MLVSVGGYNPTTSTHTGPITTTTTNPLLILLPLDHLHYHCYYNFLYYYYHYHDYYSGRAPLAHPLFSAPLVLAHLLGVPFYSFYLTKPVLFSAPPPLAHLLGVPKGVR